MRCAAAWLGIHFLVTPEPDMVLFVEACAALRPCSESKVLLRLWFWLTLCLDTSALRRVCMK